MLEWIRLFLREGVSKKKTMEAYTVAVDIQGIPENTPYLEYFFGDLKRAISFKAEVPEEEILVRISPGRTSYEIVFCNVSGIRAKRHMRFDANEQTTNIVMQYLNGFALNRLPQCREVVVLVEEFRDSLQGNRVTLKIRPST